MTTFSLRTLHKPDGVYACIYSIPMDDQQENKPVPPAVLIVGLLLVVGCAIWCGTMFFVYNGSIIYGVIGGVCVGATYSFGTQIWKQFFSSKK